MTLSPAKHPGTHAFLPTKLPSKTGFKILSSDLNSQAPDVPELAHQDLFQTSRLSVNCYVKTVFGVIWPHLWRNGHLDSLNARDLRVKKDYYPNLDTKSCMWKNSNPGRNSHFSSTRHRNSSDPQLKWKIFLHAPLELIFDAYLLLIIQPTTFCLYFFRYLVFSFFHPARQFWRLRLLHWFRS